MPVADPADPGDASAPPAGRPPFTRAQAPVTASRHDGDAVAAAPPGPAHLNPDPPT
ncbi:hypothetical protein [Frankia sp. ACN1ag]|uniref:hypothetical protein n=1 Tax=Frankia sp. ACN1ag TaxID=102891 RepID=UPI000A607802|nr:hypothetical protein [Frankia sp. ACN1ag]